MKILPIQSFRGNYPQATLTNNNQPKSVSNPLSSDVVVLHNKPKNNKISFGNLNEVGLVLAKQIPLEDRISSLFDVFKRGT